jgi:hypothetical protein
MVMAGGSKAVLLVLPEEEGMDDASMVDVGPVAAWCWWWCCPGRASQGIEPYPSGPLLRRGCCRWIGSSETPTNEKIG